MIGPRHSTSRTAQRIERVSLTLPIEHYFHIFREDPYGFLLDSALPSEKVGQSSYVGGNPFLVFRATRLPFGKDEATSDRQRPAKSGPADREAYGISRQYLKTARRARCEVLRIPDVRKFDRLETSSSEQTADPFGQLQQLIDRYRPQTVQGSMGALPLSAGAVGYFGYEAGHLLENYPDTGIDDLNLPDIYFMFCRQILAQCHQTGMSFLSVVGQGPDRASAEQNADDLLADLRNRIDAIEQEPPADWLPTSAVPPADGSELEIRAHFDEASYGRCVEKIKEHIYAGEIYQACMTQRFESPLYGGDTWNLYQELRRINPAPFACYLQFPEVTVASASPERFLSLDRERIAESRPIKGTRPRSVMPEADLALSMELRDSLKDQAENTMIVDLVRNDFGRVCDFHSVHVPELKAIEPYATVYQMVSTIRGTLREEVKPIELIRACFPGGSMTGAPKIEAMKIIDQLEPVCRGIYSGAIGYLDFAGPIDLSIVIRSFVVQDNVCYYHVGGAVVADSDPRAEYLETLTKARALKQALHNLQGWYERLETEPDVGQRGDAELGRKAGRGRSA